MMSSVSDSLHVAMRLHQTGRLVEAAEAYQQILHAQPHHADAWHLLGLVSHQTGHHQNAEQLIARAIAIDGSQPIYHNNLGEVYRAMGRMAEAQTCYQRAVWLDPGFAAAYYNLGVLLAASQPAEAQRNYEQAVRLQPDMAAAHNNLGNVLRSLGKPQAAIESFRAALHYKKDYIDALANLGAVLIDVEQVDEAIDQLEHAVRLAPESAAAHFNLGNAYKAAQDWQRAAESYEKAVQLKPNFSEAACNLANALRILGDADRAKAEYVKVLEREPNQIEALVGYGGLLQSRGHMDEALTYYDRALRVKPDSALAHYFRGSVLMFRRMRNEAILAFAEAIRLQPNYPEAYANLAIIYNDAAQPDEALDCCQRGLALGSPSASLYSNKALALHGQGRAAEALECYRKSIELRPDSAAEHSNLVYAMNLMPQFDAAALFAEHVRWAQRHAEPLTAAAGPHANDRTPDRRLRVGYVSPHFREHATNFFVEPILAAHDHRQFEVFCYSSTLCTDAVTARLQAASDVWRDVQYETDQQLAETIRKDRIDILVDLSGHMGWTRLPTFARKPAPVQVTYLGYQNTTGMSAMDYRLTDERADPPGQTDPYYTERLVRLPRAFFCYQPFETPAVTPLPALDAGYTTFGSFNNYAKVMPEVVDAWLEILSRVPRSRLLILAYKNGYLERSWHERAKERGIAADQIELCEKCPHDDYMRLIARADIALDPFPFNGHTTTCDSIWMGVPVVMLEGQTYASRFGGSVLANVGLSDMITTSVHEYVDRAVDLAARPNQLAELRAQLRQRMAASPLLDFTGFTRNLEAAYHQMWIDWCRQPAPKVPTASDQTSNGPR